MKSRKKKEYLRLSIAFALEDKPLLEELKKMAQKNRRSIGAEVKLMIEEKVYIARQREADPESDQAVDNTFFEED